jgi:hypothetical protein
MRNIGILWVAAVAGCGGGAIGSSGESQLLVGQWSYSSGTVDMKCSDGRKTMSSINGTLEVAFASQGNLVSSAEGDCHLRWQPNGDQAVLEDGQSCTASTQEGGGGTVLYDFTMGTMASSDGKQMTFSRSSETTWNVKSGTTTCSFDITATLTKTTR